MSSKHGFSEPYGFLAETQTFGVRIGKKGFGAVQDAFLGLPQRAREHIYYLSFGCCAIEGS